MGFTNLISRFPSGKALPPSYYNKEVVVANKDEIKKSINPSDNQRETSSVIGSNLENSDYARLRSYFLASVLRLINSTFPICSTNQNRTKFCTWKCIPSDYSNTSSSIISISNSAFLCFFNS